MKSRGVAVRRDRKPWGVGGEKRDAGEQSPRGTAFTAPTRSHGDRREDADERRRRPGSKVLKDRRSPRERGRMGTSACPRTRLIRRVREDGHRRSAASSPLRDCPAPWCPRSCSASAARTAAYEYSGSSAVRDPRRELPSPSTSESRARDARHKAGSTSHHCSAQYAGGDATAASQYGSRPASCASACEAVRGSRTSLRPRARATSTARATSACVRAVDAVRGRPSRAR